MANDAVDALTQSTPIVEIEFEQPIDFLHLEKFGSVSRSNGSRYSIKTIKGYSIFLFDLAKEQGLGNPQSSTKRARPRTGILKSNPKEQCGRFIKKRFDSF